MAGLAALFALTALLYASVGFGGGSTYSALLILADTDYRILPAIALVGNIIVVTGGSWRFHREGEVSWHRIWPILVLSAPFAWAGGRIPVSKDLFTLMLGVSLLLAGLLMLLQRERPFPADQEAETQPTGGKWYAPAAGTGIGLVSGMVGIGGGIFVSPLLHLTRWDTPRRIAGTASVFILVNSVAGLIGQTMKIGSEGAGRVIDYWPLMLSVLVGGQIGSLLGAKVLPQRVVRIATAVLILYVAGGLLLQN